MESFAAFAKAKLGEHQQELQQPIIEYLKSFALDAYPYYEVAAKAADVFKEYMIRPAKRLRGSFVIESYRMFDEKVTKAIVNAAIAIEMVHAYLLLIDDFNDKSDLRRGDPTGHILHEKFYEEKSLAGDKTHFGYTQEVYSGMLGMHHAINLLLALDLPLETRVRGVLAVNESVSKTIYGQTLDNFNPLAPLITENDVLEVHRYKTANYTYFNPIQLGAILANQPTERINKFASYTEPAGIAFQIQDDILGVFGDPKDTGKSNMDDIKEGKATLLTVYAMNNASPGQKAILTRALGNRALDATPELFAQVQQIIIDTGSLEHSKQVAHELVKKAKEAMYQNFAEYKDTEGFKFIVGVADYMIERKL